MTIAELHENEEVRRFEFPVCEKTVFLGHGGVTPLPRRVAMAVADYAIASSMADQEQALRLGFMVGLREAAARLIGAKTEEVAFVGPTSTALSYVAAGLQLKRHQHVLVYHDDYPSNVYPWMALADRGIKVRFMNVRALGKIRLVDVQGQVDEDTGLVALASAHYLSGWRTPVEAIGRYLRSRNVLFCVDAIQTLGAFPTKVDFVDFMAADAHKWLLGPCGAGILYVRGELQNRIRPVVHGWHNIKCPGHLTQGTLEYKNDARRYEAGTHTFPALVGLRAAIDLLESYGIEAIGAELLRKRAWVIPALQAKGYDVLMGDSAPENSGGGISFSKPDTDMATINARLLEAGVTASLRQMPDKKFIIRFTPHFYNTDAELKRAVEALPG
ncbi:MAG TPA: aminotransferase class V-fold PLP-dependent enzyme [Candidatus Limnocylindria bacterium]|nr:aminotransferase class V-fold PLP-dependent enzyme [Candidatus Limnocylindria bacterium]